MLPVPDAISAFYLICFLIGLVFVLVSAVMGLAHDVTHLPGLHHGTHVGDFAAHAGHGAGADVGHGHVGGAHAPAADAVGHAGGDAHGSAEGRSSSAVAASPLNLMTVMAFLTWFGAAGYLLHTIYGVFLPVSLLAGVLSGLVAGWLIYLFLVKVLLPGTVGPGAQDYEVVGSLARVTMPIEPGSVGEVVYSLGGSRHSDGARSVDELPIPRGTEVVIVRYEKGIAYVEPWRRFVEDQGIGASPE